MIKKLNFVVFSFAILFSLAFSSSPLIEIETALLKQDYENVQELAFKLIKRNSDDKTSLAARYYLGLSQIHLGQSQEAVETLRELTKESLESSLKDKVYLGLCDAYFLTEQYPEALETSQRLLKLNPKSDYLSLIYLKMAKASLKLAHWAEAHDYLDKIIRQFPDSLEVRVAKQLLEEKQYFAVQVGSFTERERAEELAIELKEKGEYAYIVETQEGGFYRVRVGELASINEARDLKIKLANQGYPTQIYP